MEKIFISLLVFAALFLPPWALGFFGLCLAGALISEGSSSVYIPFSCLLLGPPAAAYIAGIFLDECCEIKWRGPLGLLALSLGTLFMFSEGFVDRALLSLSAPSGMSGISALLCSGVSSVLGSAGLIAATFMLLPATYELPIAWAVGRGAYKFPYKALRPIVFLFGFSLSFHLVAALLSRNLGG